MKKSRLIATLAVVVLSISAMPVEAKDSWATRKFNDSVKRFKKCIRLDCTKMEVAKAARDVVIAIGAITGAAYVGGRGLEIGAGRLTKYGLQPEGDPSLSQKAAARAAYFMHKTGKGLKVPAETVGRPIFRAGKAAVSYMPPMPAMPARPGWFPGSGDSDDEGSGEED